LAVTEAGTETVIAMQHERYGTGGGRCKVPSRQDQP
jgi:hypothetical protein